MNVDEIKASALREAATRLWADEQVQGGATQGRTNADYALWLMELAKRLEVGEEQ